MTALESLRQYLFENGWSHGPGNTWTNPRYSDFTTYCLAEAVLTQREHDRLAAEKPEPTKPAPMAPDILPPTKADMDIWNEVSAFGDNHADHETCVSTWDYRRTWFVEAKRRAIARGLCDADGKMIPKATDAEELFSDDSGLMLPLRSHFRGCKCQKCLPEATVPDELAERWQALMVELERNLLTRFHLSRKIGAKSFADFERAGKFIQDLLYSYPSFTEEELNALISARSR